MGAWKSNSQKFLPHVDAKRAQVKVRPDKKSGAKIIIIVHLKIEA